MAAGRNYFRGTASQGYQNEVVIVPYNFLEGVPTNPSPGV